MLWLVLTLRFVWELLLWATALWWGISHGGVGGVALGMVLLAITLAVWAGLLSHKAVVPLPLATRTLMELALFALAAAALADLGHPIWGLALLIGDALILVTLKLLRPGDSYLGAPPGEGRPAKA
jgi:hypothetical protein